MPPAIGIGLKLSPLMQPCWTSGLPSIAAAPPVVFLDTRTAQFAIDEGSGLAPLSATQLAARITSTCAAHTIEDGLGQGVGHTKLINVNGLPLSKAGLQAHGGIARLHGEFPAKGIDLGASSLAQPAEGIFTPYNVVSTGVQLGRFRSYLGQLDGGREYGFVILYRAGTGAQWRVVVDIGENKISFGGAAGETTSLLSSGGTYTISSNTQLANGDWHVAGTVTPNATDANCYFGIGPNSANSGDYVTLVGAQLIDAPYAYTDWIMGGTGAITLPASRNTLPFAGGAFAFAAAIDMRGIAASGTTRMIGINDGSVTNRIDLVQSSAGSMGIEMIRDGYIGGSYLGSIATGPATRFIYGLSDVGYFRFGSVGYGDAGIQTGFGTLPNMTQIAFDGFGYDTSASRAFKYLRKFALWSIDVGGDTIFDAVKAVAIQWAP